MSSGSSELLGMRPSSSKRCFRISTSCVLSSNSIPSQYMSLDKIGSHGAYGSSANRPDHPSTESQEPACGGCGGHRCGIRLTIVNGGPCVRASEKEHANFP